MPSLNHTHTYVRYKQKSGRTLKTWYWRCAHPECTHFTHYELALGKRTICTVCGKEFLFTAEDMRRVNPRCIDCSNTKDARTKKHAAAILDKILPPDLNFDPNVGME